MRKVLKKVSNSLSPDQDAKYDGFLNYWEDPDRHYPTVAFVETTNFCNAHCICCLYDRMVEKGIKKQGIMSLQDFKWIADKVKSLDIKINAMFCLGEPFLDPTLFDKYAYGRQIDVFTHGHVGLNTNCSLLTKEKYDGILRHTDNITLSFFNVGSEFKRLTGGLSFEACYRNAVDFIRHRDQHRPDYDIFIGCNSVKGSSLENVKKAFDGFRVKFAVDAELRWGGSVITGVIDRAIMYNDWTCDGHRGAVQIKWNGDLEFCAYDIVAAETRFANIFEDSWQEIGRKFKERWKEPSSLCARCDYWHLYWKVKRNGFRYVEDQSWQKPFLKEEESAYR